MTATSGEALSDSAGYTRLHVTPLDADLVKVVLSSSLLLQARNVSYHTIETFPEKRYGFVELPSDDAEKLRRKLNGSVLKGVKIRIERAKPSAIPTPLGEAAMAKPRASEKPRADNLTSSSKIKKRKRDAGLEGVVLEEGRKVKRGWTTTDEPKDKDRKGRREKRDKDSKKEKKQPKSKYSDHAECLVKTVLPPNTVESTNAVSRSKKKKGKSREVVIHEFEKTTRFPTFLKATIDFSQPKAQLEFVEGKGWVDEGGNVVEAVKSRHEPQKTTRSMEPATTEADSSASEDSSDESTDEDGPANEHEDSSNPEDASSPEHMEVEDAQPGNGALSSTNSDPPRPKSSGSAKNLSIKIPPATPPKASKVHPLEALYKRSAEADDNAPPADSEVKAFSFFGHTDEADLEGDADETVTTQILMTPFTRHDIETRGVRSAAPTPDTAHPSRRFTPWEQDEEDIEEEGAEDNSGSPLKGIETDDLETVAQTVDQGEGAPTSDFQKWFWENRGDINRSWRKRRKQAGKEKRYRENRARMSRAI